MVHARMVCVDNQIERNEGPADCMPGSLNSKTLLNRKSTRYEKLIRKSEQEKASTWLRLSTAGAKIAGPVSNS